MDMKIQIQKHYQDISLKSAVQFPTVNAKSGGLGLGGQLRLFFFCVKIRLSQRSVVMG